MAVYAARTTFGMLATVKGLKVDLRKQLRLPENDAKTTLSKHGAHLRTR